MSSVHNVAAVTLTLQTWLLEVFSGNSLNVGVLFRRLDKIDPQPDGANVNIFLFDTTRNSGYASIDQPARRSDGSLAKKPVVAVDLSYLATFLAPNEIQAQELLARFVRAVHAHPGLTIKQITDTLVANPLLGAATLADRGTGIKLSMPQMSLDEMSKLWGMFPSTPFRLSVRLLATTVLLESDFDPEPALPVQKYVFGIIPSLGPSIGHVWAKGKARSAPILTTDDLTVEGVGIGAADLKLVLDTGKRLNPKPSTGHDDAFDVPHPGNMAVGVRTITAEMSTDIGTVSSAPFSFLVRPILSDAKMNDAGTIMTVTFEPDVEKLQDAVVVLSLVGGGIGDQHSIALNDDGRPFGKVNVDLSSVQGLDKGKYVVRLRIDGAESLLEIDYSGSLPTVEPEITINGGSE